ncbi:MAG: phenylacetate--CoA ligase family protein [Candidatus Dormibacteraeota bacterium]|nr:phenylacetate--CoA ligase family protein [Candidatus Dormibacteraeota bacterium]MBO0706000.1 phenylacetate--CoA ligase family protein [Candidatus Dormibacteraeota bacterium]MBO0762884.1 phenylacetate--CoA ligase family protein [Candidatus Dormibacteraeota bacterium]
MEPTYWRRDLLTSPYWNRYAETLTREQLDALALQRVKALLRYVQGTSRFYREAWARAGFDPAEVRTLDDVRTLVPLTDKEEVLRHQAEDPPYGRTRALGEEFLAHHSHTSGTTGMPFNVPFTAYDTERYGESWVVGWWALGIRPHDVFYFAFNWGAYAGFWSAYWGARRLGARVVSGGGADTETHVHNIVRERPTVLIATPSFALRIAEQARAMGLDLADSSIRYTYHAGEPGPCSLPALRDRLDREYGAISGELLGVAELDAMAPGCPERGGVHMSEFTTFSWTRDPVTGKPAADGDIGENVITTFANTAQPLVNYNTHDLVRAFSHRVPCGCGRTWRYLDGVVLGRSDFMVTVRGTNVYPTAVENLVLGVPGASEHFQLRLTRDDRRGSDEITVRLEPAADVSAASRAALGDRVGEVLRERVGLRMPVEILEPGTLPRTELKVKRIVDERPAEARRELER